MSFFKRKNGITMIELMAVVVIISIFTVISVPEVAGYLREQKEKALLDNLNTMRQAISLYMQDHSRNKRRIPSGQYHSGNYFELFSLSQPSNQDEHLSFPLCLHQLVKDKYLLFIPQNPFTGDDSWEVRGFGEPVDNSNSWIQAVQKNPSTGKYDSSFSISDYRPYIPKGTSNANLQLKDDGTPQSPIINDLIGVFDVRSGYEGGRDNFSDIDSWKQREQGTWKYIKNELLRLSLSYREKILEVNEVLNLVPANITVTAYMLDGSTKTVIPSWDWQNPLTPGPGTLSGTTYTAPPTAGQAILRATYTEDDITKYADLRLQIFAELDFLVLQPSLIPIVINNTVDLDAKVLVRAHYTDGSFSYVSGVKYTIIEGDGFMSGSTYNAPSTTGMVKVSVEYTQGSITKSQTLNIQVTAELEKIIIDEPERNVAAGEPYFLNSRPVYAYYGDGVTKELAPGEYDWILFNPDPSKGNLSGPGNSIYNAPNHENTVIITCVYTEGEITVQAELKLNVMKTIEEIYLSPLNIVVRNLDPNVNMNSRIKIVAEYTDGSTAEVSAGTWSMVSGLGEIESGWAYKVPTSEVGTALVRCAVSDWFQTKTKDISIEIKHRVKELVFDPPEGYVRAGEVFDLSAVNLQVLYTDGLTGSLNYGDCMVEVAPGYFSSMWSWDNDRLLSTVITASGFMFMRHHLEYDGEVKIFDYRINVLPRVKALKITPNEIELKTGDTFDLSVVTGIVEFHDGSTYVPGIDEMTRTITTLPLAKGLISGYEYQAPPDKANYEYITFAYEEDYDGNVPAETVTDTFEVFIHRVPVEIYVMPFPHETATFEGDPNRFDRMRMNQYYVFDQRVKIKVYWTDNTESISEDSDDPTDHEKLEWELLSSTAGGSVYLKDLEDTFETMAWVYEPAPITSGTAEVKVTFTHFGISQETTFKIVVLNAPEDVYLTPNKIHAYSGTEVYLGDIDVEVHFADGDIIYYKIGDYVPGSYIYLIDGKGDFEDVPYYDTETDQEVALFYVFYESNFFMSNPGILEVEVHVTPKRLDFVDTMANYTAVSNRLNYEIYYASWEGWKAAWDIWYYTDWPTWKAGPRITSPPVPPQSPYTVTDPYYSAIYDTWYTNWRNWADYFDKYPGYDLSYNSWKTAWDIWKPLWDTWLAGPRDIPPSLPPSSPYGPTDTPYYSEDYENWYNSFMYWLSFWESYALLPLPATYPLQPDPLGPPPADPAMAHWPPEPTAYAEYSFYKNVAAGADVYLHHTLSSGGIFLMVTYSDGTPVEVSIYDDAPSGNPTVINNVYMVDFDGMLEPVKMEYYYEILSGPGTLTAPPGKTNFIYTSPGDFDGEVKLRAHFRQKDIHPDDSTTVFHVTSDFTLNVLEAPKYIIYTPLNKTVDTGTTWDLAVEVDIDIEYSDGSVRNLSSCPGTFTWVTPISGSRGEFDGMVFSALNENTGGTTFVRGIYEEDIEGIMFAVQLDFPITINLVPPQDKPLNLIASNITDVGFRLDWDTIPTATSYDLYQDGIMIASNIVSTFYNITGLTANTSYDFTLRGKNGAGQGPDSDVITVKTKNNNAYLTSLEFERRNEKNSNFSSLDYTPDFDKDVFAYTSDEFLKKSQDAIKIRAKLEDTNGAIQAKVNSGGWYDLSHNTWSGEIPLDLGVNNVTIRAYAEEPTHFKDYVIEIEREATSNNAYLSSLSLRVYDNASGDDSTTLNLTPGFSKTTFDYNTTNKAEVNRKYVTFGSISTEDSTASIEWRVNGGAWTSNTTTRLGIDEGDNTLEILVTAENGTSTELYTVNFRKKSTNAKLSNLVSTGGALSPGFDPDTTSYTIADTTNTTVRVTATLETHPFGNYSVRISKNNFPYVWYHTQNNINSGTQSGNISLNFPGDTHRIEVIAKAEDASTTKTYVITIRRKSNNANLSVLSFAPGSYSPVFNPSTITYTINDFANSDDEIKVTPTVEDWANYDKIEVRTNTNPWEEVVSGDESNALPLKGGDNAVQIRVTAEDGTQKTYTANVFRNPWRSLVSGTGTTLEGVFTVNSNVAYVVGDSGTILKTTDGGINWNSVASGHSDNLRAVSFIDENTGVIVGRDERLMVTENGGSSFTQNTSINNDFYGAHMFNSTYALAIGSGSRPLAEIDKNGSWDFDDNNISAYFNAHTFRDMFFIGNTGWAVGDYRTAVYNRNLWKTTDGGDDWDRYNAGSVNLYGVHFVSTSVGWVVGDGGAIYKTTNGGSDWNSQNSTIGNRLRAIYFLDANKGYAVGENGKIVYTSNGGSNWREIPSGTVSNLIDIHFSGTTGYIVGAGGRILKYEE